MKKVYIILFCMLFLLIPTYIAISYIVKGNNSPVVLDDLQSVTLVSPNGAKYSLDYSESDPDSQVMYSLFYDKKAVSSLPSKVSKDRAFTITYNSKLYQTTVTGYFSTDPSNCYLEYRTGVKVTYYRISTDAATAFLDSDYSEGVYDTSVLPVLVIGGKELSLVSADWNYITYSGNEKKAKEYTCFNGTVLDIGSISSDFVCQFNSKPDEVSVIIKREDTGAVIYSGDLDGIGGISVKDNHNVNVTIDATWNKGENKQFSGTVRYAAKARLHRPAYFFLSEPQIKVGEFVVLSAKNIIDISKLEVSCEPEINYTPVFFRDGDYYRALLPVSIELGNERRVIKITLKYEDTVSVLDLLVLERGGDYKNVYNIDKSLLDKVGIMPENPLYNPYAVMYQNISASVSGNTDFSTEYFNGRFDYGYHKGVIRAAFGDYIRYSAWGDKEMCRSFDYFYAGNSKTDPVTAVNRGKVVYVGTQNYSGPVVVVDHGYGLLSWYSNLGSVASGISVGQVIEKGSVIGYNGGGGLSESYNGSNVSVHVALTVFGVPVDMAPLTTEGVIILDN